MLPNRDLTLAFAFDLLGIPVEIQTLGTADADDA